ncbi:hypothetical protein OOK31_36235 [Streptomyces sp. NBC_00249]|nr:hypothetical protein [Streptomyces sp. NBC_00249]MCX5199272.1 hypothetical protein [Streptomyces sp. NBC_00249]
MLKTTTRTARRLSRAALFSLVRGASYAMGASLTGYAIWWLQH